VEKAKDLENSIRKGESVSMRNVYSVGTPADCILPSRRASGEYYHLSAEEKHAATDLRRASEGEAKEEEVAPSSIDHEVVSEGAGSDTVPSQEPGSEPLRRSIVICEEIDDDDIFDQIVASTH